MSGQVEEKYQESQLYKIRHSAAHIMAQAVIEMFPEAKYTIGPPVENGFYYDFELPEPISAEDLPKLEKRMRQIIAGQHDFEKEVLSSDKARDIFKDQPYKLELIDGLEAGQAWMNTGSHWMKSRKSRFTSLIRSWTCVVARTWTIPSRSIRLP